MALLPLPAETHPYVSTDNGKPSKEFYNYLKRLAAAVAALAGGGGGGGLTGAIGTFTLTPSATTTTVFEGACAPTSFVDWSPRTPDAANDMATTSAVAGSGQFVMTHANNPRVDRTFGYLVVNLI